MVDEVSTWWVGTRVVKRWIVVGVEILKKD